MLTFKSYASVFLIYNFIIKQNMSNLQCKFCNSTFEIWVIFSVGLTILTFKIQTTLGVSVTTMTLGI